MSANATTRILLLTEAATAAELRLPLEQAGYAIESRPAGANGPLDLNGIDLVVVDGGIGEKQALAGCRHLSRADGAPPILIIGKEASAETTADAWLPRPFAAGQLQVQVQCLLRQRQLQRRLAARTAEVAALNERLRQAYRQTEADLALARKLQHELVPRQLPDVADARFAVYHRPGSPAGGDCFDVFRLDNRHVAFYLADVLGHGVTAGLLTLFLRRAFSAGDLNPLAPEAVLLRLNRLLLEQAAADPPLVALVCGVLDGADGTLRWARAGLPPPLWVPATGPARLWSVPGGLLGVCETAFPLQTSRLAPGDRLLLTSDGLDLAGPQGARAADRLLLSAVEHRAAPVGAWLDHLTQDLAPETSPEDDWTLLALEVG